MSVIGKLLIEREIFQNELTLIDSRPSFVSQDEGEVTKIEIQPDAGSAFHEVTTDKFLVWAFATLGAKVATLRLTTTKNAVDTVSEFSFNTTVVAVPDLLCKDEDLLAFEPSIMRYLPTGRSSFIRERVRATKRILDHLWKMGVRDKDDDRVDVSDLFEVESMNEWAVNLTLQLIFEGMVTTPGDIYAQKSEEYRKDADTASSICVVKLKTDDADQEKDVGVNVGEIRMGRA